ncbi:hypothetical protein [Henriciella mobilis]|jgi:hypothetical protein|uniref:hypothetical protein n=1 Tax=Henriciella mobilis TaxID=2305467 RepID=UPI001314A6EC|nr:hypothetical protein [Henriciella mobilis]|tara:strand:- start:472 stop:648 length:177 start_codon:yes stop_codon:yes gene_type:complete
MTEPPGDSRRAVFRALIDATWAQAEGSLIELRRKKIAPSLGLAWLSEMSASVGSSVSN